MPVCDGRIAYDSLEHLFCFFNDTATTDIYTLSLHDALPISFRDAENSGDLGVRIPFDIEQHNRRTAALWQLGQRRPQPVSQFVPDRGGIGPGTAAYERSEEHTSELQSRQYLVCRLLLEKKKN